MCIVCRLAIPAERSYILPRVGIATKCDNTSIRECRGIGLLFITAPSADYKVGNRLLAYLRDWGFGSESSWDSFVLLLDQDVSALRYTQVQADEAAEASDGTRRNPSKEPAVPGSLCPAVTETEASNNEATTTTGDAAEKHDDGWREMN